MVRLRAAGLDEHLADPRGERQVGPALAVQVAELAPSEPELDAAEAVRVDGDALPRRRPRARSARRYPPRMPFYQRLGDLPRKRHIVHRDNGTLLTEEVMGFEGFSGLESILYHLQSPCRVIELGEFEPIVREEWVPDAHAHRHLRTWDVPPAGDAVTGRQLLMWNNDVEISLCRPTEPMDCFFRNGEGDEVIFVHEGTGTLETIFGDLPYKPGDYIVVPRGTTYRFAAARASSAISCSRRRG